MDNLSDLPEGGRMTKDKLEEVTTDEDDVTIEEVASDTFAKELEELLAAADRLERALDEAGLDSKSVTGEPIEEGQKSASTFGRQIAALAEEGVSERVQEYLRALATVVRISKPSEWGALAAILARIAPKAIKERADQIAEKMAKEGGSVYGYPYPAPTNGEEKSLADVVSRLDGLEGQVKELAESVTALKEQVHQAQESAQKALEISPRPSVSPIAREVTPVGVLAQKLIGG
jgi:ubiquinone biosynthesis protein UbiJ